MFVIDREDRKVHEDRIEMGDTLFVRINEKYHSRFRKPISVMGADGLCFNVIWESGYYDHVNFDGSIMPFPYFPNFSGEYLTDEIDRLDLTFISRFDVLIFEGINEYSYHIIKLLNEAFPEKKTVLLDEYSGYFKDIRFETVDRGMNNQLRSARFLSGHTLPERKGVYTVYSLMLSLTWCRIRHINENAPIDATVLLIDIADDVAGFGDLIKKANVYYNLARKRGWIPVVALVGGCQYRETPDEDCWLKFFEPVSEVDVSDLDKYRCRISVSENRAYETISSANPYLIEELLTNKSFEMDLRLNKGTLQKISEKLPKEIFSGKTLGVMIRGTDRELLKGVKSDTEYYVGQVRKHMGFASCTYDHIFLATEDANVLKAFKLAFKDKLLYVDQMRVSNKNGKTDVLVYQQLGVMYTSKYQLGCDYLAAIYALTACETILYNIYAGACYIAENLKSRIKEKNILAYMDYSGVDEELDKVMPDIKIRENRKLIIYGAGDNAVGLINYYLLNGQNTILCDRKAVNGEYEVCGITVISPERLREEYSGEYVIVSPYKGKDQMIEMLKEMGIPEERLISCDFRIQ